MSNIDFFTLKKEKKNIDKIFNISSVSEVASFSKEFFDCIDIYEEMNAIYLNKRNDVIGYAKIGQGGVDYCPVDVRLISLYAVKSLATGVILVHNHPSGDKKASKQDKEITSKTKNALDLFGIKLLDHVIVTNDNYYSFFEDGLL